MVVVQNPQINVVYRTIESYNRTDPSFIVPFKQIVNGQAEGNI